MRYRPNLGARRRRAGHHRHGGSLGRVDAFEDERLSHGDGVGVVDREHLDRRPADRRPTEQGGAISCEMVRPPIGAGVEEPDDLARERVDARDVRALAIVAGEASQAQIIGCR